MKLYTEEQVKDLLDKMEVIYSLKELTPIELPSDEEIEENSELFEYTDGVYGFKEGVKWLKKQILNQNK